MTACTRLKLRAEDTGDLAVISACLEDSVFAVGEMAFEPADHRFAAILVRRCREAAGGPAGQAKAAIHFDDVSSVKLRGIDRAEPARLLTLAGMFAELGRSTTVVRLLFQEGAEIWIESGHLACHFQDLEEPQPISSRAGEPAP
ncbi:MAG: DUF2948 family protein [Rhodospirillales bacterium]|nr:DUF2948 family protein [Rhodospirillales bacterium]